MPGIILSSHGVVFNLNTWSSIKDYDQTANLTREVGLHCNGLNKTMPKRIVGHVPVYCIHVYFFFSTHLSDLILPRSYLPLFN